MQKPKTEEMIERLQGYIKQLQAEANENQDYILIHDEVTNVELITRFQKQESIQQTQQWFMNIISMILPKPQILTPPSKNGMKIIN